MTPNSTQPLRSTAQIQVPGLGVISVYSDDTADIWQTKSGDGVAIKVIFEFMALRAIAAVERERETAGSNQGDGDNDGKI